MQDFLIELIGSYEGLIHAISRTNINAYIHSERLVGSDFHNFFLGELILIIKNKEHKFKEQKFRYSDEFHGEIECDFEIPRLEFNRPVKVNLIIPNSNNIDYKYLLLQGAKTLRELRSNY